MNRNDNVILITRVYESLTWWEGGGGEYRTEYRYGTNHWESNVISGVFNARVQPYYLVYSRFP